MSSTTIPSGQPAVGREPQARGARAFSMDECIERCIACYRACEQAVGASLELGADVEAPVRLLIDCGDICRLSASYMLRGSDLHPKTCDVCAEVCERCALACAQVDDELVRACGETCRDCAESCRYMAQHTEHPQHG